MMDRIRSLHEVWNQTTGQTVNLRATERIFFELANLDFTADDLLSVLKHVLHYNKTHAACPMKVQVHKLCGDVEAFASICAEAKAKARNKVAKPTPKESVLHAFRGVTPEQNGNPHHIREVFASMKEAIK